MAPLLIRIPVRFERIPFKWDFDCQPRGPPASALTLPRLNHPSAQPGVTTPMHQSNHCTSQLKSPPPPRCPRTVSRRSLSVGSEPLFQFLPWTFWSFAVYCFQSEMHLQPGQPGQPRLEPLCTETEKQMLWGRNGAGTA